MALLSSLAEAPDLTAAATLLLADVLASTGARRALLMRVDPTEEQLLLAGSAGFDDPVPKELAIAEGSHPWMVATLARSPVVGDAAPRVGVSPPFERWTALPMPPGGVVIVDTIVNEPALQEVASVVRFAGPVLFRVAAHLDAALGYERANQERGRFQQMVDSLPDPVVITDDSDIVAQNKRAEHLLIVTDDDSPGRRRAVEFNNLLFSSFLRATIHGPLSSGARELNLVDPDEGDDLLFEVLTHPLEGQVGPENAMLSVLRDVTDLRRASYELERQVQRVRQAEIKATDERDRLNLILENVADPILVTDSLTNIILMNDEAEQLFQGPPWGSQTLRGNQAVRQNDTKFTSFISDFTMTSERTRRERMTLTHPRWDVQLPVEVVSGIIQTDRGEPIAMVSVIHDRTQQAENERLYEVLKKLNGELEGRIAAATRDLAQQNERLLWQSEELAKASKLKTDFLASMSHELRTPLNAVIGYSALLLDGIAGPLLDQQRDFLSRSRAAAQHLLSLISDILDLAKIEAGKMPLYVESVDLPELIDEVAKQVEPMMAAKNLAFATDVAPQCATIETDKTKVRQVLLNLLSNAVKFTNRGTVRVSARCDSDSDGDADAVLLEVHDTGVGIKPEELDAIWEDFRQLDQSRTRSYGGTGLGLSITRRLTSQLGGQVSVRSRFGQGTTFTVRLPMTIEGPDAHVTLTDTQRAVRHA